jgi:hypothetical protein
MFNVNNVLPTPYKDRKMKNFNGFDDVDVDEKRKRKRKRNTKNETASKKIRRRKKYFKTNVLVPKNEMCEGGATVAATPLPSAQLAASLNCQAGPAAFSIEESKSLGNSHKILQMSY